MGPILEEESIKSKTLGEKRRWDLMGFCFFCFLCFVDEGDFEGGEAKAVRFGRKCESGINKRFVKVVESKGLFLFN